ncbi:MAG: YggS family pyridoxal phosphate-dependent enzyme [Deltaproteobacteria bacterium]|nr:YggS family pyridoxal phosphate-dependent enzyme [Deltaproteobacteria bacterium]
MSPDSIATRLDEVQRRVHEACVAASRPVESVTLLAVSKGQPPEAIRAAYEAGQRDFGENYAQELAAKAEALADLPGLRWHFIGPLQRNKVKLVVGRATLVHSVDSVPLLAKIDARAGELGRPQDLLLQLNLSGEATKSGSARHHLPELLGALRAAPHVRCLGLMTLPPPVDDPEDAAPFFAELAALAPLVRPLLPSPDAPVVLSMGMSHDFPAAIRHGATLVRVGTAIFGERRPRAASEPAP